MPTTVKNSIVKNIGIEPQIVAQTDNAITMTVIGLSLTNLLDKVTYVDIILESDGNTLYYLKNAIIPFGSSLRAISTGEKLVLGYNNILKVSAYRENSVDAIISYAEIIQ